MNLPLPQSIAAYFDVSNGADHERLTQFLVPDSVVRDEGRRHEGYEAIRSWLQEARRKFAYNVEPLNVVQEGADITVLTRVTGNFPGSPIQLEHIFHLVDGKIQALEIH